MDYKKILAATAVTSAAFVVPVVAEAAANPAEILGETKYELGEVITAPAKFKDNAGTEHEISSYEWLIDYGNGYISVGKTNSYTVPIIPITTTSTVNMKLVVTKTDRTEFEQLLTIDQSNYKANAFEPYTVDGEPIDFVDKQGLVNQPVQVKLPDKKKIVKYEWFIFENNNTKGRPLAGEEDQIIEIPIAASNKKLVVIMTDDAGKKYVRDLQVLELKIDKFKYDLKLNGKPVPTSNRTIAPGDTLSIENLAISGHDNKIDILPSQANVTYQWYYKGDNEKYSIIPGATSASYVIPNDAFGRNLKNISVEITVEVPDSNLSPETQFDYVIELNYNDAINLNDEIKKDLIHHSHTKYNIPDNSEFTSLETFNVKVQEYISRYNKLSDNSKKYVTDYPIVEQAAADIVAVEALVKELDVFSAAKSKFDDIDNPSEVAHSKLIKQFAVIESKYSSFDGLKRSLLDLTDNYKDLYMERMAEYLKNINGYEDITANLISEINKAIKDLFTDLDGYRTYAISDPEDRKEMAKEIARIEAEIKKVDRAQQYVINSSLVKNAKADLKKAEKVADLIAKIEQTSGEKRVKAILAARTAYNKLTFMQQSLITETEYTLTKEYSPQDKAAELVNAIAQLTSDNQYVLSSYSSTLIREHSFAIEIDLLLAEYKALPSKSRPLVTNYSILTQAKKDIKSAERVIASINKAIDAHVALNELEPEAQQKGLKSVQSKYKNAYNAYLKLNVLQRSIVDQSENISTGMSIQEFIEEVEELTNTVYDPINSDPSSEVEYDGGAVSAMVDALADLEATVSNGSDTPSAITDKIKELEAQYKALKSQEKKAVYNYNTLSRAKSLVKKASSVEASLLKASQLESISRMESALKGYYKLTTGQQQMIRSAYDDEVIAKLKDSAPDLTEVEAALEQLAGGLSEENLLAAKLVVDKVDKKELQKLADYPFYEEALKVQKKVDSFLKKYNKLGTNPTYSKKQSIIKDFNKFTASQLTYFENSYAEEQDQIVEWSNEMNDAAVTLNSDIGNLFTIEKDVTTNRYYYSYSYSGITGGSTILTELRAKVTDFQARYKVLESKERKLVTHYSFLSKIERDIQAVERILELAKANVDPTTNKITDAAALKTVTQAYNRLTNQQQDLFDKYGIYDFKQ